MFDKTTSLGQLSETKIDVAVENLDWDRPDTRDAINDSGRKPEFFANEIRRLLPEDKQILRRLADDFQALDSAIRKHREARNRQTQLLLQSSRLRTRLILFTVPLLIAFLAVAYRLYGPIEALPELLQGFLGSADPNTLIAVAGLSIPLLAFLAYRWARASRDTRAELELLHPTVDDLRTRREEADQIVENNVHLAVQEKLNELLGAAAKPSYATELGLIEAPGLSEVYDEHYKVNTEAIRQVERCLERMPGGSIGIAGKRGSGKTTLMRSFCGGGEWWLKKLEQAERPVLAVMIPAPVDYEGREFILHLFSCVCRRFLKLNFVEDPDEVLEARYPLSGLARVLETPSMPLQFGAILVLSFGVFLLLGAWFDAGDTGSDELRGASAPAAVESAPEELTENRAPAGADSTATPDEAAPDLVSFLQVLAATARRVSRVLGLSPGATLLVGGLLVLASLFARHFEQADPRKEGWRARETLSRSRQRLVEKLTGDGMNESEVRKRLDTVDEALGHLRRIKFQESYTSGWSGALKLPIGLEWGKSTSVVRAEKPLSLPEIVDRYAEFIGKLSEDYEVLIGIDELDKIDDDRKVQRFLNEIKIIFGLEHCFYLLSVSESAMSSFERRGLRIRNVFDSSFDEIIYAEYLNFEQAQKLIRRRVVGMPVPVQALCYCLSGGLPRDLIRACRDAVEQPRLADKTMPLDRLCECMLTADIEAKLRAMRVAAKEAPLNEEATRFLTQLHDMQVAPMDAQTLRDISEQLLLGNETANAAAAAARPAEGTDDPERDEGAAPSAVGDGGIQRLREEISVYMFYCARFRELFTNALGEAALSAASRDKGALDQLAAARQVFSENPTLARLILMDASKFRL